MTRNSVDSDLDVQPLIGPEPADDNGDLSDRAVSQSLDLTDSSVESKSSWYLFLLTLSLVGLQITWSVEMSNGSPFLLSLGMSKSLIAFVWLAGPLSGVLVQPYVGILSDNCRISWGKRKPFILGGALATVISLMAMAWTKEIVTGIASILHGDPAGNTVHVLILAYATILIWILDFAINTMQAGIRAFIVDNAPAHQQEAANAWASRIIGIGNVICYIFGAIDGPKYLPFFGNTQFKVLCVVACICLVLTLSISCGYVQERDPRLEGPSRWEHRSPGLFAFFKEVFLSIKRMPPPIRRICEIQFFHWIGWFPFLFYITTYIGQLYANPYLKVGLTPEEVDAIWAKATRVGTFALLIYAIVSLSSNMLLPFFVVPTYKPLSITPTSTTGLRARSSSISDSPFPSSITDLSGSMYSATEYHGSHQSPPPTILTRTLSRLQIPGLTLRRAWLLSQLLFSACMFSTFFISTAGTAGVMVAIVGIPWSLTLWAPFALISAEVAKRDEQHRRRQRAKLENNMTEHEEDGADDEDYDQAGVILGLHNVAVSSPQVLATLISSVIFHFLQLPRNLPGDTSVSWTLRLGGVAGLAAAFMTSRLSDGGED